MPSWIRFRPAGLSIWRIDLYRYARRHMLLLLPLVTAESGGCAETPSDGREGCAERHPEKGARGGLATAFWPIYERVMLLLWDGFGRV